MYNDQSQLRRPWSPDEVAPNSSFVVHNNYDDDGYGYGGGGRQDHAQYSGRGRREASDVSVEALDLADYARTLRPSYNPYGSANDNGNAAGIGAGNSSRLDAYNQQSPYPAFSSVQSLSPPSLVSRGDTLSSSGNSHYSGRSRSSFPARGRRTNHRPMSLPATHSNSSYRTHNYPYLNDPALHAPHPPAEDNQMDTSHFPAWSRSWYNSHNHDPARSPPQDIYTPLPKSHFDVYGSKRNLFDPDATLKHGFSLPDYESDPYPPYSSYRGGGGGSYYPGGGGGSSNGHESLLPWSSEPPSYGPPVHPSLKEERIRMLEREFGQRGSKMNNDDAPEDFRDAEGKPLIGTVDDKGNLVTQGPRKRLALRIVQVLLAGLAGGPAIYAALFIKVEPSPEPAGKPAAFVLYIFSILTFGALFYLVCIRPCCGGRRKGKNGLPNNPMSSGMMVLPVQGMGGKGKKNKGKWKKGKKGGPPPPGDVQVNLIVDPTAFGGRRGQEEEEEEYYSEDGMPGGFNGSNRSRPRKSRMKRRSVFAGLAMEEAWKAARVRAKKMLAVDVFGTILWMAVFVFIMIGKRCVDGSGWCTAYNTSTACACLLAVSFAINIFLGVKDLGTSKVNPRTRT